MEFVNLENLNLDFQHTFTSVQDVSACHAKRKVCHVLRMPNSWTISHLASLGERAQFTAAL